MFTWINKQGVRSDQGFELQFTGRFDAQYRQGQRVVSLHVESGHSGGVPCILIEPHAFDHWDGGERIPKEHQERMFANLREAVHFQGLILIIEGGEEPPAGAKIIENG